MKTRSFVIATIFACLILGICGFTNVLADNQTITGETNVITEFENLHVHEYETVVSHATCTQNGFISYTCKTCDASHLGNFTLAGGHLHSVKIVHPTCTANGYTVYNCVNCKHIYTSDITHPTNHQYEVVEVEATCTEKGCTLYTCTSCQHIVVENEVEPTDHNYETKIVEPTKESKGYDLHTCNKCGDQYKDNYTKAQTMYPLVYSDETCTITIYKEWFENAWVYAAHITFADYSRLSTDCANGQYDNGYETTSHAAQRLNAIFAVNGCYSAPCLNYTVVRGGKIWNGADRNMCLPALYSSHTGLLLSAWEGKQGTPGINGVKVQQLVDDGLVTDTFCFGPPGLINGVITDTNTKGSRAQRTFIGTNGNPGDIWICVSDGRYNDGVSAGLTGNQCMRYLESKGCTFGVNLDGGGSSTMYFNGKVLNAADGNERAVVDFLYFK